MNTGTILIVDDNKGVLASLELLLENYFSKILTASIQIRSPALLTTRRIDVVILDMNFSAGINRQRGTLLVGAHPADGPHHTRSDADQLSEMWNLPLKHLKTVQPTSC